MKPFFELDGKTYEIKRTRYLECKQDEMKDENKVDDESQKQLAKINSIREEIEMYTKELEKAREEHLADIADKVKKKTYKALKAEVDELNEELLDFEIAHNTISTLNKMALDNGERLLILALAEQYFDFDEIKAKATWERYVEKIGKTKAGEWVLYMVSTLFSDEEDDPFLAKAKAEEQRKAQIRNGLLKAKK